MTTDPVRRVLVTGASGFVGGHVLRALGRRPNVGLRYLVHRDTPELRAGTGFVGDLGDPESLNGICEGIDTVVHAASYGGADPDRCALVNGRGTAALVAAAGKAGVGRFIYLSTATVYGPGPHRGAAETRLYPAPHSVADVSRLAAERIVLAAGGIVLRPMFVYGDGDLWFVTRLVEILRRLPVLVNGGRARLSVIAVDELAEIITALAMLPAKQVRSAVYHVSEPDPVSLRDLVSVVGSELDLPIEPASVDFDELVGRPGISAEVVRELALVAVDRWYDGSAVSRLLGHEPGPGLVEGFGRYANWYRRQLLALDRPQRSPRRKITQH
ncbi:MAG TPA: NAD-dependent epimerase/dehydratase family protein [Pseudonocardiaceae bacterium]|jgi:nucleoside-diphosphate-sugar epimerase|nr:NAD-dependent epimerase/dehydratase family protein [Pseudonocardiaceae bacterium]